MKLHFRSILSITLIAFLFSNCATIVSSNKYSLHIRTDPKRANVVITDKKGRKYFEGRTPTTVKLKSGAGFFSRAEYSVKISSPGYSDSVIPVEFKLNGWYFGNVLLGGFIGMLIIDPATGAMWKIADPIIDETLIKADGSASTSPSLNIIDINSLSKEAQSKLVAIK